MSVFDRRQGVSRRLEELAAVGVVGAGPDRRTTPTPPLRAMVVGVDESGPRPLASGHTLGDLLVDGEALRFGGQVAQTVRVRLRGLAEESSAPAPEPVVCAGAGAAQGPGHAAVTRNPRLPR